MIDWGWQRIVSFCPIRTSSTEENVTYIRRSNIVIKNIRLWGCNGLKVTGLRYRVVWYEEEHIASASIFILAQKGREPKPPKVWYHEAN